MKNIDFTIDQDDLKALFISCKLKTNFDSFENECKQSYADYHKRNLNDPVKYGQPKTFSQWINGQIIALC